MIPKFNFLPLPEYVLVRLHWIDRGGDNKDLPFLLFKVWTKLYLIVQNSNVPLHISEYCVLVHNYCVFSKNFSIYIVPSICKELKKITTLLMLNNTSPHWCKLSNKACL